MKILAVEQICDSTKNVLHNACICACYPDSSLLRNNDDFYIPEFSSHIAAYAGVYVQISKIGKCVDAAFVYRYFSEMGVAVNFIAKDLFEKLQLEGLSTDIARGFDKSFAVSTQRFSFQKNVESCMLEIEHANQNCLIPLTFIASILNKSISTLSSYYTLKIGDYVFIPLHEIPSVSIGDCIHISCNNRSVSLQCKIQ